MLSVLKCHVLEKTRADNSGYTNHRVICLVVIGSSFDSEQVAKFIMIANNRRFFTLSPFTKAKY
jgi:hypothetical protein